MNFIDATEEIGKKASSKMSAFIINVKNKSFILEFS